MAAAQTPPQHTLMGVDCAAPPVWHCPDSDCQPGVQTQPGDTVELRTRRTFFLDCPSDYKPGDKVNIVLSLHGFGSYANWERNYFPAMDVKDKYKLVVITPGSPIRYWTEADDEYLHNASSMKWWPRSARGTSITSFWLGTARAASPRGV